MSTTERLSPEALFADVLLPLKRFNERRNLHYFPRGPEPSLPSYWEAAASRTGGVERLGLADGDGAALLARLGQYWSERGEDVLTRLLPDLERLWGDLFEPEATSAESATVSLSAYPLF